ncbi:hypothetical protein [Kitasatospora sp. NPDC018619]|uniref:hypothetical protein n=1 Tax=unclassified Kitasatospora TaxID=2633591 RepID=UPI0037B6527F
MRVRHAAGLSAAVVSAVVGLPLPAVAAEPAAVLYVEGSNSACANGGPGTTVPVSADGYFDIANHAGTTDVIADLFGYYRNQ